MTNAPGADDVYLVDTKRVAGAQGIENGRKSEIDVINVC